MGYRLIVFMTRQMLMLLLCVLLLSACELEPTPFPVELPPTPTATPPPESLPPLRYALAPNTGGAIPDMDLTGSTAQIIPLLEPVNPADLGVVYDLVVQYGDTSTETGWQSSELVPRLTLVINPATAPLDNHELRDIVRRSLNMSSVVDTLGISGMSATLVTAENPPISSQLRTELANFGLPDGFALLIGTEVVPGIEAIATQIMAAGIEVNLIPMSMEEALAALDANRIQAALMVSALDSMRETWITRFGADNVVDLYTLPVSYQVIEGITVTFSPAGFPIMSR